jgi:hypothetical protein
MQANEDVPRLRVMAEYSADPIWTDAGEVDLQSLPISDRLRRDLRTWADLFDTLPATKFRFQTPGGRKGFNQTGRQLAHRLEQELGHAYTVEYVPT